MDVAFSPDPTVLLHQASVWLQDGHLEQAEEALRRTLAADPASSDALSLLGLLHHERGDRELGVRLLRAAIALDPTAARHHLNLGQLLAAIGDRAGAASEYRRALSLNPTTLAAWASLIFEMDLNPFSLPLARLADRRAFNNQLCAALTAGAPPLTNDPNPDRPLHVGYLGADFRNHSAAMVFGPMLDGSSRDDFTVSIYWVNEKPADEITAHFKPLANGVWREVAGLDDAQLAQRIRDDGVDILVDLSGYSTGARPLALARKPAPLIMTGWGHVTGLGIDAVDHIIADATCVPPEHAHLYHEKVLNAPCVVAYNPWSPIPELSAPPFEQNQHTTFGYFGRPSKGNALTWGIWAQVLHRLPHSRLILKHQDYATPSYRQRILDVFSSLRIAEDRVEFRLGTSRFDHLATHAEVDLCLDPFPQGGGVTLLEACVMGVPSVTLMGNYLNGRIAPSVVTTIGHPEWVASSHDEYVDLAVSMAERGWSLAERMQLREDLLASVICRPFDYARAVEDLYRGAWRDWCAEGKVAPAAITPPGEPSSPADYLHAVEAAA